MEKIGQIIRKNVFKIFLLAVIGITFISGCIQQPPEEPVVSETPSGKISALKTELVNLSGVHTEKSSFIKYYYLDPINITLQTPQYNLPLQTREISNFQNFSRMVSLSGDSLDLFEKNGFAVINNPFNPKEEDISQPYKTLKYNEIPIFITSDSLLHLYHIQFDETLRQIEEREFYDALWGISKELLDDSVKQYDSTSGDVKESAKRNAAFFAIGLNLLKPREDQLCIDDSKCKDPGLASAYFKEEDLKKYSFNVPDFVKEDVNKEMEFIGKHAGFEASPVFIYKEDYSQYVPRGHYTRSEKLKNYFKAFMWYGRITMLLKGSDEVPTGKECGDCDAFISPYDSRIQTRQASLIASKFEESKELRDRWERIYSVTAFYVGLADDLGPYEYNKALNSVFSGKFKPEGLTDANIEKLKLKLSEYQSPEIYGGTGACGISPPFKSEDLEKCLNKSKGFRLMGQRFIPDSYMFQNLVFPKVGKPLGQDRPFTWVMTPAGIPVRGFPRGLDVMALLDSKRAGELLDELNDSNYNGYDKQFSLLKEEFDGFNESEWNRNLYWSWLYSLKPLLKEFGDGYPTFMQTKAWQDKELTTALASWAELRHDTILYAKQSYTPTPKAGMPSRSPVVGYIEPVPEFYNRLLALTRMTTNGLDEMNVLDGPAKQRLQNLDIILSRLVELSGKELENRELTEEDYKFIKDFGEGMDAVIGDVEDKAKKTTIIADVHTDTNSKQVLEEGLGYVNLIVVAYKLPDGRILIGAGPVMTYYEFKQPMENRLTDETWREILSTNPPKNPEWISNFSR